MINSRHNSFNFSYDNVLSLYVLVHGFLFVQDTDILYHVTHDVIIVKSTKYTKNKTHHMDYRKTPLTL